MKQKKNTPKTAPARQELPSLTPLLPGWIIASGISVWAIVVLYQYAQRNVGGSLSVYLDSAMPFNFGAFMRIAGPHAVNFLAAAAIFAAAYGIGRAVLRLAGAGLFASHGGEDERGKAVFSFAVGLGILALLTFGLGTLGMLHRGVFLALIGAAAVAGLAQFPWGSTGKKEGKPSLLEMCAWVVFGIAAVVNLTGALSPETFYDSQFYQLGLPNRWMLDHILKPTTYMPSSFMPFNINMLYLDALMINNEISAKLVHFLCGILLSGMVYSFANKYFNRRTAVFAALIFYTIPMTMITSWKTAIELGIGVFEFGMVYALINYMSTGSRRWLALAGALCGFSLGSKYTSVVFAFLPAAGTLLFWSLRQKKGIMPALKAVALFSLCAALVSAPWYLRNIIETGNPVFPFLWDKIGFVKLRVAPGLLLSDPAHPPFTFVNYFLFLWPMTMGTLQQENFSGPLFLALVPLFFLFRRVDGRVRFLFVYLAIALFFWATLGRFYLRYFVPTLTVASIGLAYYVVNERLDATFKGILQLAVGVISFLNIGAASATLLTNQNPLPYVVGNQSMKEYLSTQRPSYPCPYYPVVEFANNNLPQDAKILFLGETRGLYSRRPFMTSGAADASPIVAWVHESSTADEVYAKLREHGVTHFLLNVNEARRLNVYDNFYWEGKDMLVFDAFWKKYVTGIYRDIGDLSIPQQGIVSMRRQNPGWWQNYAADPRNYVYLYAIEQPASEKAPRTAPYNFLAEESMYAPARWGKFEHVAPGGA